MVSIPKVISVMSCGVLLCLGLSSAAQADNAASVQDEMKADQSDRRQGGQLIGEKQSSDEMKGGQSKSGKTIKGEVLRVEGDTYFVKGQDGKEVRLRTDNTTQKSGVISQGDRIEASMNEQNLALLIRSAQGREAGSMGR
jgi:opacity protein-like surface antigen